MMEAISAVYRDGVLLPLQPLAIPEGSKLTLCVDPAANQREHLTEQDRQFLKQLAKDRAAVFRRLAE
jgi:predicted DNA-binding antitoxin AbrB/MazE fold protein